MFTVLLQYLRPAYMHFVSSNREFRKSISILPLTVIDHFIINGYWTSDHLLCFCFSFLKRWVNYAAVLNSLGPLICVELPIKQSNDQRPSYALAVLHQFLLPLFPFTILLSSSLRPFFLHLEYFKAATHCTETRYAQSIVHFYSSAICTALQSERCSLATRLRSLAVKYGGGFKEIYAPPCCWMLS